MNWKNRGLAIVLGLLSCSPVMLGMCSGGDAGITTRHYMLNSSMKAGKAVRINANKLSGCGTIEGQDVFINCDECEFTGTITCHRECVIRCKTPFDYSALIIKGAGTVTVIISPYDFESFTESELSISAHNLLFENILVSTEVMVDEQVELIRYNAALNNIDENKIFGLVVKKLNEQIGYHRNHLGEQYSVSDLGNAFVRTAATVAGLGATYLLYRNQFVKTMPIVPIAAFVSFIPLFNTEAFSSVIQGPQHQERLDKLLMIKDRIDKNLSQPYVSDQVQVVKLQ